MRRATEPLSRSSDAASFSLAPYSNRVRDGRFEFDGRSYDLRMAEKHAIHGDVRDRPWSCVKTTETRAEYELDSRSFDDFNFPFSIHARTSYVLDGASFTMKLDVENTSNVRMPAGGGFHPYFVRALAGEGDGVELEHRVGGVYPAGDPPLPTGAAVPISAEQDFQDRRPLEVVLDHCFSDWDGQASILWPKSSVQIDMTASESLRHLIVYSPESQPFFALEPVSHANDAFNLARAGHVGVGMTALEPGEVLSMAVTLQVKRV